jgi:hypothetical protein
MLQPKKPVVKKTTKKTKSVSERLGDVTLRDIKNAGEDTFQLITLGGYGKIKKALGSEYKYKEIGEKKYGGKINKAKNGTSLGMKSVKAGFDKNPGVTRADIITAATKKAQAGKTLPIKKSKVKGNPAFELEYQKFKNEQEMRRMKLEKEQKAKEASYPKSNKAKSGATVKKAAIGALLPLAMKALPMVAGMLGGKKKKMGGTIKKAQTGNAIIDKASKDYKSYSAGTGPKPALSSGFKNGGKMKMGGSMKKCKYGCK